MLKPDTSQIVADVGLGMRDFTGLLTLIGSDAVDNSMGRIAIDPLSFMMSVISSFGLIGLTRNLLKQAIGKYNCEALGFDIRGIMSTYKNPFNNEFYNLRGLIRCRVLTENGLENIPGSVRTYFLYLRGVRAWKDKIIVYANIKKSIKTIYLKLSVLATVTAILSTLRLLAVISVVDFIGFTAIITYVNAVLLGLFGFSVWFHYIRTIFNGESEDDNAVVWLVTTTRDNYGERTTHYTILKGFKPLNKKEMINKPMVLTRILAGFAMVTSIISYTAILSLLQYAEPSNITVWLLVECALCLLRMIVWASPKVKALLAPTSDHSIQPIEENDEKIWKQKTWFTTAPTKQWSLFSNMPSGENIEKSHIALCPSKNIRWTNENLLKLLKAGLVYDIDAVGANNYVSLILMSSVAGRCKFIRRYNLDTVFEDIQKEYTNNLLLMNNIGLREFSDILEIPEWALGKDNTAIGKYLNHYGREMWIIVECPGDPYDLNIRMPRPERQITKKGYSFIKSQWFEMDIIGVAKQQGIDVDPKDIGKPRPCDDPFTIERLSPKVDMSGAPKYADCVV